MYRRLDATTCDPAGQYNGNRALSSAYRQARDDEVRDLERRRLYFYSHSAISRSAAHDEAVGDRDTSEAVTVVTLGVIAKLS